MRLEPVSVLATLRELWTKPRDMARFHAYLDLVKGGGTGELMAPLVAANPMAREHMVAFVDALAALPADGILAEACREAERRLPHAGLDTRVSLVPIDDVRGAWSERTLVDLGNRFPEVKPGATDKYRYLTALVYASETPTADLLRQRILAAIYRSAWIAKRGGARTVGDMMRQEGHALRFAGVQEAPADAIERARAALEPHLDATLHATRFCAMYGDKAARRVGHKALGIPDNAGFIVGLADAPANVDDLA